MANRSDHPPPSPALPAEGREESLGKREVISSQFLSCDRKNPGADAARLTTFDFCRARKPTDGLFGGSVYREGGFASQQTVFKRMPRLSGPVAAVVRLRPEASRLRLRAAIYCRSRDWNDESAMSSPPPVPMNFATRFSIATCPSRFVN